MRCKACDKALSDTEIQWNKELNDWEVCSHCLEIAMDAAYSDGFKQEEDVVAIIEEDVYRSWYDHSDAGFVGSSPIRYD